MSSLPMVPAVATNVGRGRPVAVADAVAAEVTGLESTVSAAATISCACTAVEFLLSTAVAAPLSLKLADRLRGDVDPVI